MADYIQVGDATEDQESKLTTSVRQPASQQGYFRNIIPQWTNFSHFNATSQPIVLPMHGMNGYHNATNCGSNPPYSIPTRHAPLTAGVPAYSFQFATNQHGNVQHGQVNQGNYGNMQHGAVHYGSSAHGFNEPGGGTPRVNTAPTQQYPAQGPGHHDIDTATAKFQKIAGPSYVQRGPGDLVDQVYYEWQLEQPQHGHIVDKVSIKSTTNYKLEGSKITPVSK